MFVKMWFNILGCGQVNWWNRFQKSFGIKVSLMIQLIPLLALTETLVHRSQVHVCMQKNAQSNNAF